MTTTDEKYLDSAARDPYAGRALTEALADSPELTASLVTAAQGGDRLAHSLLLRSVDGICLRLAHQYGTTFDGPPGPVGQPWTWPAWAQDLLGAAYEGAVEAVANFEPGRGAKFSTYAYAWIKNAVRSARYHRRRELRGTFPMSEATTASDAHDHRQRRTANPGDWRSDPNATRASDNYTGGRIPVDPDEEMPIPLTFGHRTTSPDEAQEAARERLIELGAITADTTTEEMELMIEERQAARPKRRRHPWATYFDGELHELRQGEHFDQAPAKFAAQVHQESYRKFGPGRVRTNVVEDRVFVRALPEQIRVPA